MAPNSTAPRKRGIIFVEARLRDNIDLNFDDAERLRFKLEVLLSQPSQTFDMNENILADQYRAILLLGRAYEDLDRVLFSLTVLDHSGPKLNKACHTSDEVIIKVQVYKLYRTSEEREGLQHAEITPMPHIEYSGQWDRLVFGQDIKGELIRLVENMLRFSQKSGHAQDMNALILFHGPPGMGKTSLCQGLAQKISIRLNSSYKRTKFVQIKTATLLSKFYSQSAKHVDEIFTTIEEMCAEDEEQFLCVLIDEVESIANSRESSMNGEVLDSLRATNALLTGLDRAMKYPNVIFLCTSNMPECLDPAFLDRCGLKTEVSSPPLAVKYEILRDRIQQLIEDGLIFTKGSVPSYRDALLELDTDKQLAGSRLLAIAKLIDAANSTSTGETISCRALSQLPAKAVMLYLEDDECDMEMAFQFIEKSISVQFRKEIGKLSNDTCELSQAEAENSKRPELKDLKARDSKGSWEVGQAYAMLEVIGTLFDTIFPGWRKLGMEEGKNGD